MNIDPVSSEFGEIKQLTEEEAQILQAAWEEAIKEKETEKRNQVVQFGGGLISTILLDNERKALEHIAQHERPQVLKNMRSHNKSANRRAKKKIADASRRRNRK